MSRTCMILLLTLTACGGASEADGTGAWEQKDGVWEITDAPEPEPIMKSTELAGLDIQMLSIRSDGRNIILTYTFLRDIKGLMEEYNRKDRLATGPLFLYFDTDGDPRNGGIAVIEGRGKRAGFEASAEIAVAVDLEWSDEGREFLGAYGYYSLEFFKEGEDSFEMRKRINWEFSKEQKEAYKARLEDSQAHVVIDGKTITVDISYAELGVGSGTTVRLLASEQLGSMEDRLFLPELTFKLE